MILPNRLKPLLVTGSIRSGTTWVGRTMNKSPVFYNIHEPFNPGSRTFSNAICTVMMEKWFMYITESNESKFYKPIKKMVESHYDIITGLFENPSLSCARRVVRESRRFYQYRKNNVKPLIKDPLAVLSAEWLYKRFALNMLVLIRHPAAVVSSLKRLNWKFDPVLHLLTQPLLMQDHLHPFASQFDEFKKKQFDIIDQASMLWKVVNFMVKKYSDLYDDWLFLRYEDLCDNPVAGFRKIYNKFGIEFTDEISRSIDEDTGKNNPEEIQVIKTSMLTTDSWQVNSKANKFNWVKRLSKKEILRIRRQVEDVSCHFYSDDDWCP